MYSKSASNETNSSYWLYVLFYLKDSLFAVSSQYVSDLQPFTNNTTILPNTPPYAKGICNSYGRIITTIDLEQLLNFNTDTGLSKTDENIRPSNDRTLIILHGEPLKGLIVGQIVAVEQSQNLHVLEKNSFVTDFVRNVYLHEKTQNLVMELDVPKIISAPVLY